VPRVQVARLVPSSIRQPQRFNLVAPLQCIALRPQAPSPAACLAPSASSTAPEPQAIAHRLKEQARRLAEFSHGEVVSLIEEPGSEGETLAE